MVKIKICGVTNVSDAMQAAELGADAVGLNFFKESPRYVNFLAAAKIIRELPAFVEPVAVFVNEEIKDIKNSMRKLGLRTFQFHNTVRSGLIHPTDLPVLRVIPAFAVREGECLAYISAYLGSCLEYLKPAAILLDAHVPGSFGGTGQTLPWDLLADFRPGVPVILAGGLTPENVAKAIRLVRPYAVDVASGVESSPGKKDADKMKRFIEQVKQCT
jgi:phosphoribosylanthranilate isomerase